MFLTFNQSFIILSSPKLNRITVAFVSLFVLLMISCTQSDDQREFEKQAISLPENFTQTDNNGQIVDNNTDPDDWRIAPFFQGFVYMDEPPFPNALLSNQRLTINFFVTDTGALSGFRVLALYDRTTVKPVSPDMTVYSSLNTISLDPLDIAQFPQNPVGLYRIIIEDDRGNIISYGDIKIE